MEQFGIVLNQLIGMGVMMLIGYICVRTNVLGEKALDGLCSFILKVGIPLIVFATAVSGTTRHDLIESGQIIVLDLVMYVLLIGLFTVLSRVMRLKAERGRLFRGSFVFGNVGFMGLPLFMALYPDRGALYFALCSLVDQTMMWTYGVWTSKRIGEDGKTVAATDGGGRESDREHPMLVVRMARRLRPMLSPALVAVAAALVVIISGARLPTDMLAPLKAIGSTASPLSMVYLGGLFALRDWMGILRKPELYVGIVAKMLMLPIVLYMLCMGIPPLFGFALDPDIVHTITLACGMPTMVAMVMFAEREHNHPEYAIGMVMGTTIASLFTLSAVSYLVF
ncbi:AEC family transporter [Bifidobacterium eulemuris]|uniref:AEC family transporter n=1 Tax=Bifidobacterium eulemuris TaxID=1765219 RepID=A0A261GD26_9BIFI|nr:AEC family transporter [Bifidobacterium eulemuris]OZG69328.1 permease [Bifidobacterium eulemuris]QOL31175.1 AEC family transporter [Bifidobacterium eulemuris]